MIRRRTTIGVTLSLMLIMGLLLLLDSDREQSYKKHSPETATSEEATQADNESGTASSPDPSSASSVRASSPNDDGSSQTPPVSTTFATMDEYYERLETDPEFAIAVIKKQVEDNPQAMRRMRAIEAAMIPFEFHGRVIDQNGDPVADATVAFKLGYPYGLGYTGETSINTDAQGRFMIRDRADSLLIKRIRKHDYRLQDSQVNSVKFRYEQDQHAESWADFTRANPYIFVVVPFQ